MSRTFPVIPLAPYQGLKAYIGRIQEDCNNRTCEKTVATQPSNGPCRPSRYNSIDPRPREAENANPVMVATTERLATVERPTNLPPPKPILKWAGGKTQLLQPLLAVVPNGYRRYIEPFLGGGALFFAMRAEKAVLGDSNPELVNLYQCVRDRVPKVIKKLKSLEVSERRFYELRGLAFDELTPEFAAARTIYLNRTCFNGLYRVNRKGHFNVPFGRYRAPVVCQEEALVAASRALCNADILLGDYRDTLRAAGPGEGDFIYLDPPYLPVSKFADFKRYTREQFRESDHVDLAAEMRRLHKAGCYVVLTNSNHPMVYSLYPDFAISVHKTRRHISSNPATRHGEDVIVIADPREGE